MIQLNFANNPTGTDTEAPCMVIEKTNEPQQIETKLNLPEALKWFEDKYNVLTETTSLHGKMLALKVFDSDHKIMIMYARRQGSNYQIFPSKPENNEVREAFGNLCQAVFNSNLWIDK